MSQLLKHRERLNLTQEQLAKKAQITARTIQRIEAGKELRGHIIPKDHFAWIAYTVE
ncbi:MAG: helix-turn-helix transcriptional regulator [Bacteroidota bacterium]